MVRTKSLLSVNLNHPSSIPSFIEFLLLRATKFQTTCPSFLDILVQVKIAVLSEVTSGHHKYCEARKRLPNTLLIPSMTHHSRLSSLIQALTGRLIKKTTIISLVSHK